MGEQSSDSVRTGFLNVYVAHHLNSNLLCRSTRADLSLYLPKNWPQLCLMSGVLRVWGIRHEPSDRPAEDRDA
jgi:hypothetical protein